METSSVKLHPVILKLFEKRGVLPHDIDQYLSWNLNKLPSLLDIKDLDVASKRVIKAINENEPIGIYGDYDVDGTTSCALLYHFFKLLNVEVKTIQPSRFVEGYGIHPPNIDQAIEAGIKLLITVDCGITNNEAATHAKNRGLDLIITDHHKDASEVTPEAYAIVNPNRRDEPEDSPLRVLAGVGVAFALAVKIKKELEEAEGKIIPSLYQLLPFFSLGTICDLAKLTPINLTLSRHGLKEMKECRYAGFQTFLSHEERKLPFVPSEKLAFNIGPMINAKGRLDHPEKALTLLTTSDREEAQVCYNHLEIANRDRKFIQREVFNEAKELLLKEFHPSLPAAIIFGQKWHEGVIGIVASKIVEHFKIPAIIFTETEEKGIIKASARTAGDLDLFNALKDVEKYFLKFGGHKAACGLSMKRENFTPFKEEFLKNMANVPSIIRTNQLIYDLEVNLSDINPDLVKQLELLEPYGQGNERPLFVTKSATIDSYDILKIEHVRWNFSDKKNSKIKHRGISFNFVNRFNTLSPDEIFTRQRREQPSIYFKISINRFNGNEFIQLQVEDVLFTT